MLLLMGVFVGGLSYWGLRCGDVCQDGRLAINKHPAVVAQLGTNPWLFRVHERHGGGLPGTSNHVHSIERFIAFGNGKTANIRVETILMTDGNYEFEIALNL